MFISYPAPKTPIGNYMLTVGKMNVNYKKMSIYYAYECIWMYIVCKDLFDQKQLDYTRSDGFLWALFV